MKAWGVAVGCGFWMSALEIEDGILEGIRVGEASEGVCGRRRLGSRRHCRGGCGEAWWGQKGAWSDGRGGAGCGGL